MFSGVLVYFDKILFIQTPGIFRFKILQKTSEEARAFVVKQKKTPI